MQAYETGAKRLRFLSLILALAASAGLSPRLTGQTYEQLYQFQSVGGPQGSVVEGPDGSFYGVTQGGGTGDAGAIYQLTPAGQLVVLANFDGENGAGPVTGLTLARDGTFYGITQDVFGTVFQLVPSTSPGGAATLNYLLSFDTSTGVVPTGLMQGRDGNLYGTAEYAGTGNLGTVFEVVFDGSGGASAFAIANFTGPNGSTPYSGVIQGSDGNFYGTTELGGSGGYGTVFQLIPSSTPGGAATLNTLVNFDISNGAYPYGGLVHGSDGNLYGTTFFGGNEGDSSGYGTVFQVVLNPIPGAAATLNTLVQFTGTNGEGSLAGLVQASDGSFYGTTADVNGDGTIFRVTPSTTPGGPATFATVVNFNGSNGSGGYAPLINGSDGNLYGTTVSGGVAGLGAIFQLALSATPGGAPTFNTIFSFNPPQGADPDSGLLLGADGNFYGTTQEGGAGGGGTIYQLIPSQMPGGASRLNVVATFNGANGQRPESELIQARDGNIYGVTGQGGAGGYGTVYQLIPSAISGQSVLNTLCSFDETNGDGPNGLVEGNDGGLYGTTYQGGAYGYGTIFRVTRGATPGAPATMVDLFDFDGAKGKYPTCSLIQLSDGSFYGTATSGGAADNGTVFQLILAATPGASATVNTLISFDGTNGSYPSYGVIQGLDGNLYGTTSGTTPVGEVYSHGGVFQVIPSATTGQPATLNILAQFRSSGGYAPSGGLVQASDGALYGTLGGLNQDLLGAVFKVTPGGSMTELFDFDGAHSGDFPQGKLLLAPNGSANLYGTDINTIYQLSIPATPTVTIGVAEGVSTTGATLPAYLEASLSDVTYYFQYGLTASYGSVTESQIEPAGSGLAVISATLTGLAPNTLYHYSVVASDGRFTSYSKDATFSTVNPVQAFPYVASIAAGTSVLLPVLAIARDLDGDPLSITTVTSPAHGAAVVVGNEILYTPAAHFHGSDSFSYQVSDGNGGTGTVTVTLNVGAPGGVSSALTVAVDPAGMGSIDAPPVSVRIVGDQYTLTATPRRGYAFSSWTSADSVPSSTANPLTFTMYERLALTAHFTPIVAPATVELASGQAATGDGGASIAAFGPPETGPMAATLLAKGAAAPAILDQTGDVLAAKGAAAPGQPGWLIAALGQPSGDLVLATLAPGKAALGRGNVGALISGLVAGAPAVAAETGAANPGLPVKSFIERFLAIDGAGTDPFFLALLPSEPASMGGGTGPALCTLTSTGEIRVLVRAGQSVSGKTVSVVTTLVGSAGTLADARWRVDDHQIGVRLTFANQDQAIYTIPSTAASPTDWTLLAQTGSTPALEIAGSKVTGFGLPAFSPYGCAVVASLATGKGSSGADDAALLTVSTAGTQRVIASKGDPVIADANGVSLSGATIKSMAPPVIGVGGNVAFLFTASDSTDEPNGRELSVPSIGYSADGSTWGILANAGAAAPGGGHWARFLSLALPKGAESGPLFTGLLATEAAAGVDSGNALSLWAVDSSGTLQLELSEGESINIGGNPTAVRSFTALTPAVGSTGAASGYDDQGDIEVVAKLAGGSSALLRLTVP